MIETPLPRILLVEDNPTNRLVICAMLRDHAEIEIAENGEDGLEKLSAGDYDGALVDIRMPVMDGETMMARWREVEAERGAVRMPAAACTSNVQPAEIRRIHAAGFDRHLEKPVMIPVLREVVEWIAVRSQGAAAARALAAAAATSGRTDGAAA